MTENKNFQVIQIERNDDDDNLPDTKINHGVFETKERAIQYISEFLRDWAIANVPSKQLPRLEIFEENTH